MNIRICMYIHGTLKEFSFSIAVHGYIANYPCMYTAYRLVYDILEYTSRCMYTSRSC